MNKCDKDKTPCLHAPCTESQGVKCCADCENVKNCTTECFKVAQ